jgi:hypothetical protein
MILGLSIGLPLLVYVLGGALTAALIWELTPEGKTYSYSPMTRNPCPAIFGGIFWWCVLPAMLMHRFIIGRRERRERANVVTQLVADALAKERQKRDEHIAEMERALPPLWPEPEIPRGDSQPANGTGRRKWRQRK